MRTVRQAHTTKLIVAFRIFANSRKTIFFSSVGFNPLNAELNPICHLLALVEAHHILHVSRIRVKFAIHAFALYQL